MEDIIVNHYRRCRNVILKYCKYEDGFRSLIGDHKIWWKVNREKSTAKLYYPDESNYDYLTSKYRTLYWTAQLFTNETANIEKPYDLEKHRIEEQIGDRSNTLFHSFFLDLDKAKGKDVHDPEVVKWLEKGIKFFADKLLSAGVSSFGLAFSGGGCYCVLHPRLGAIDFELSEEERVRFVEIIQLAFDLFIGDVAAEFFEKYPEAIDYVKFDKLNYDKKRQVKTLLSVHKKYPYAVVPIDKDNPHIDFGRATIPVSDDVIAEAGEWLVYKDDIDNFGDMLAPYLEKAKERVKGRNFSAERKIELEIEEVPIERWAPCIRNILNRKDLRSGQGATRALAVLASYMRYVGVPEEKAYNIFQQKAREWDAETSNIFECWYGCQHLSEPVCFVPSCGKLKEEGSGYPHPELGELNICVPTERCEHIRSPIDYHKKEEEKGKKEGKKEPRKKSKSKEKEKEKEDEENVTYKNKGYLGDDVYFEEILTDNREQFIIYDIKNNKWRYKPSIEYNDTHILPTPIPPAQRKSLILPDGVEEYGSLQDLRKEMLSFALQEFDPVNNSALFELTIQLFLTSWIASDWMPALHERFIPIIAIRGPSETGKKRFLTVARWLSYRSMYALKTTRVPTLFRSISPWGGTLIVDEADLADTSETSEFIQFMNSRADGVPIPRYELGRRKVKYFYSFGMTVLAERSSSSDDGYESRKIVFPSEATNHPDRYSLIPPDEWYEWGKKLQRKLLLFRLRHLKGRVPNNLIIDGIDVGFRVRESLLLLQALKDEDEGIVSDLKELAMILHRRLVEERSGSIEGLIMNIVYNRILDENTYLEPFRNALEIRTVHEQEDQPHTVPLTLTSISTALGKQLTPSDIARRWRGLGQSVRARGRVSSRRYSGIIQISDKNRFFKEVAKYVVDPDFGELKDKFMVTKPLEEVIEEKKEEEKIEEKKEDEVCDVCGKLAILSQYKGQKVCKDCLAMLKNNEQLVSTKSECLIEGESLQSLTIVKKAICERCGEKGWIDHEWVHEGKNYKICTKCVRELRGGKR